jgi:hypothetical protein
MKSLPLLRHCQLLASGNAKISLKSRKSLRRSLVLDSSRRNRPPGLTPQPRNAFGRLSRLEIPSTSNGSVKDFGTKYLDPPLCRKSTF